MDTSATSPAPAPDGNSEPLQNCTENINNGVAESMLPFRPLDAVPPDSAHLILSVSVGNSRLHWALHTGQQQHFVPTIFWRYVQSVVITVVSSDSE
jgi:hypothetical protein